MIKRGTDTFSYDSQNRLTSATVNGTTAQNQYNSAGQRVAKTVLGQTTYYLYGQDGQLLAEADANTHQITRQYIWLGNKPVAYLFGDKGYYVHTDNTDTPQVLTDSQQKVVWTTQTYPFGKQQYSGSIAFNLRYPGQYFDEETGLHYNGHRYYDPNTGRYITSDPIGLAGGINTYAYVGNNPLGFVDPLGLHGENLSETPFEREQDLLRELEHPITPCESNLPGQEDVISPLGISKAPAAGGLSSKPSVANCSISVSKSRYPESVQHIQDAIAGGKPDVLTIDRVNAAARRRDSLRGTVTAPGFDRDEYPPAMFQEGGRGSSVRLISPGDNRGAGSCIGAQCRGLPDGTKVHIDLVD